MEYKESSPLISLFFAMIFVMGGWLAYSNMNPSVFDEVNVSEKWSCVQAKVVHSKILALQGDDKKMYTLHLSYVFTINNETYEGDGISMLISSKTMTGIKVKMKQYTPGSFVRIYYNTESPDVSCFEPDTKPLVHLLKYTPLLFCLLGVIMILRILKQTIFSALQLLKKAKIL